MRTFFNPLIEGLCVVKLESRTSDTFVTQNRMPLKPNAKPIKQKLRHVNPLLLLIIDKDARKFLDAKIIIPLRYSN